MRMMTRLTYCLLVPEDVLRECAAWLGMDEVEVRGTLLCGTAELRDLTDLEVGQVHDGDTSTVVTRKTAPGGAREPVRSSENLSTLVTVPLNAPPLLPTIPASRICIHNYLEQKLNPLGQTCEG